ncbi:MAG: hypothetical protein ACRETW_00205 [Stenotrophobium sp.]
MLQAIHEARTSIHVAAYSFTSKSIATFRDKLHVLDVEADEFAPAQRGRKANQQQGAVACSPRRDRQGINDGEHIFFEQGSNTSQLHRDEPQMYCAEIPAATKALKATSHSRMTSDAVRVKSG